jgi:restriction system protein
MQFAHLHGDQFEQVIRCNTMDFQALVEIFQSEEGFDPQLLARVARLARPTSFMTSDFTLWQAVHFASSGLRSLCSAIVDTPRARGLILIDHVGGTSTGVVEAIIARLLELLPNTRFLIVGFSDLRAKTVDYYLKLGPLSSEHLREAIRKHFGVALDELSVEALFSQDREWRQNWEKEATEGLEGLPSELLGDLTSSDTVRARLKFIDSNRHLLRGFARNGLLGPDGKPLTPQNENLVLAHVRAADAALLDSVLKNKASIHSLSPRQFEELVAHVLERFGYSVTLTPATKDGGLDIYAAVNDRLGQFLYVVECKKFAPDRPVGVGLVRALYGTVEEKRASAGLLVTTSHFTSGAQAFQRQLESRLSLRDYVELRKWLDELSNRTGSAPIRNPT